MDDLESLNGVGSTIASKLRAAGYTTIEAIAVTPPLEIAEKTKLGFNTILKIQNAARKMLSTDFRTAQEYYEIRKNMKRCTTGCKKLDEILGGGVETQALTELIGEYGSGKTQICMMLSVTAQLPYEKGGLEGKVAFIDTEGTFMPERIYQIASGLGLEPSEVASNILVARAYNSSHQCLLIDRLFTLCPENNVKLVVVDSMISHFRGEYIGRETLSERQQKLNKHMHELLRVADTHNVLVYVTNQVMADPSVFFGDPTKSVGGNIVAHASTFRIYLRKGKKGSRVAKLIDSPNLPDGEAAFMVETSGLKDF